MTYVRVAVVLHLYSLEQCLNPVLRTSIKTCNFVNFYKFLIHLGVHHTSHKALVNHVKEPTDKFKLEHLWDALLKTLAGQ
jgi:hypothetical protein